jgi:hypothetical protein
VYNLINPVLNAPLNLAVWANGIVDVGWSVAAAAWNTVVAEANYFLGWILPPLPPLPPRALAATTQTTALSSVAPTSTTLAGVGETLANALKGLTDGALAKVQPVAAVDQNSGVTGGEKNPVQTVVADLEAATSGAADQLQDAAGQLKNSVETVAENVVKQLPGTTTTTQTDDVTTVPKSARQSLQPQKPATTGTSPRSLVKDVGDGVRNATADLKSNVQKATDGLRNAVKDAGKGKTKTETKPDKTSTGDSSAKDKSDKSGGE